MRKRAGWFISIYLDFVCTGLFLVFVCTWRLAGVSVPFASACAEHYAGSRELRPFPCYSEFTSSALSFQLALSLATCIRSAFKYTDCG